MKILFKFSTLALLVGLAFTACKKAPKGEAAQTGEAVKETAKATSSAKTYSIANGQIMWTASKVGGQHMGTFNINKGELAATDGKVESGAFQIDMASLTNTDMKPGDGKEDLEGHLKGEDFFDVANHAAGNFEITNVAPLQGNAEANYSITGNLTLKGVTKSVTFPANIVAAGNKLSAVTPAFKINRTEWGIKYGSGLIGTAKDKIIHDEVALVVSLEGNAE
ncbi:MAG: YceI family protein [Bacteroidota bacterium]